MFAPPAQHEVVSPDSQPTRDVRPGQPRPSHALQVWGPSPVWRTGSAPARTLKPHHYLRLTACRRTDVPLCPRCTIVSTNEFLSSHRSVSSPAGAPAAHRIVLKGNGLRRRDMGARVMRTDTAMLDTTGAGRRPTVLIASHQESSSRSLESILGPNGYTVLKAYTAPQTLERARRGQPDAIILDATLPDQDPLEICRALRHDAEFAPDAPIIIVSSDHATRQQRIEALRAGAWEYLGQPLDAEHLLLKLETFTRVKRAADRAREDGLVDQVTGLYNLRGLARRARELGAQASRLNAALACVALAPDFGDSTPGSEPPDAVLEAVVAQLAGAFRATGRISDALGRLGRTEFAVVASGADAGGAVRLAERLASAVTDGPRDSLGTDLTAKAPFRLRAGYSVVSDARVPSADPADTILGAASALQLARAEPGGPWIRSLPERPSEAP